MKLVADSRGRLTAVEIFRPESPLMLRLSRTAARIIELVEKKVPVVPVKFNADAVSFASLL
jgi:hypothetical protein